MYQLELNDIIFAVKSLKFPGEHFNILEYVKFTNPVTRSGTNWLCYKIGN